MTARPGLQNAISFIEGGRAGTLVAAKLDRLSRSLLDFVQLMERSRRNRWALVLLDLGVDTTTPSGELVANVIAAVAQNERRLIGQRTREALAVRRSQGVRLGRPPGVSKAVRTQIVRLRRAGLSFAAIADRLERDAVPTGQGGIRWYPATVRKLIVGG